MTASSTAAPGAAPAPQAWHALEPAAALAAQGVTIETGLSSAEADARRAASEPSAAVPAAAAAA